MAGHVGSYWHIRIFCAGVPSTVYLFPRPDRIFQPTKVLLTMGLQRETAGRGALAIYTSVCPPCTHHLNEC
jgi:hypothetical protein